MSSSFDKFQKRRLISSYFSVVLSIFLVLFLLGMLGFFIINSKKLADDFKEKIAMTVFFKNEANDSILKAFGGELKTARFAKSYVYVTKETAAKQHTDIIGEEKYNQTLSNSRATEAKQIIERALSGRGIKGVKFESYGFGEDTGMAPFENNLVEERFYNRSVIIDIIPAK